MPATYAVDVEIVVDATFYVDASSTAEAIAKARGASAGEVSGGSVDAVLVDFSQDAAVVRARPYVPTPTA